MSCASESPDLQGYPVIRLDQISQIETSILMNAEDDVLKLIDILQQENGDSKLVYYLTKQIDVTKKELAKRAANERVKMLLNGVVDSLDNDYSLPPYRPPKQHHQHQYDNNDSNMLTSDDNTSVRTSVSADHYTMKSQLKVYKPIPLPSEVYHSFEGSNHGIIPEGGSKVQRSRRQVVSSHREATTSSTNSSDNEPSKESIETLNRNFGNSFMVAATDRKIRFYPKKAAKESAEDLRMRERLERRKLAMKRLMERRENQSNRKLKKQSIDVNTKKNPKEVGVVEVDSESEESVSGGDDDEVAAADPALVQILQNLTISKPLPQKKVDTVKSTKASKQHLTSNSSSTGDNKRKVLTTVPPTAPSRKPKAAVPNTTTYSRSTKNNSGLACKSSIVRQIISTNFSDTSATTTATTTTATTTTTTAAITTTATTTAAMEVTATHSNSEGELILMVGDQSSDTITAAKCDDNFVEGAVASKCISGNSSTVGSDAIETACPISTAEPVEASPALIDCAAASKSLAALDAVRRMRMKRSGSTSDASLASDTVVCTSVTDISSICSEVDPVDSNSDTTDNAATPIQQVQPVEAAIALIQHESGRYSSDLGPDDLPGLRAWTLATVSSDDKNALVLWGIDVNTYYEPIDLTDQLLVSVRRARGVGVVRMISQGLVYLAQKCQSLLTGALTGFTSNDELYSAWDTVFRDFDCHAASLEEDEMHVFFDKVEVCGNCFAICKKLETLLKTHFIAATKSDACPLEEGDASTVAIFDDSGEGVSIVGDESGDARSEGHADDDEEGIVPQYHEAIITSTDYPDMSSAMSSALDLSELACASPSIDTLIVATRSITGSNESSARLLQVFHSFSMLFPCSYGGVPTARALIESMQTQCKLYEEWIEVMGDYATVFSEDRGIASTISSSSSSVGKASSSVYHGSASTLHYRVKSIRPEVCNIVNDVFNSGLLREWVELPPGLGLGVSWNMLWTWSKPRLNMTHLLVCQKVNHFVDSKQLTRKDMLKKNLQRYTDMSGKVAEAFEVMPTTFVLPHEYTSFVQAFTEADSKKQGNGEHNYWIMKPVGLSRGRGISLVKDLATLTYSQTSVIQKYIERPLCLAGYKFDLRIFVVVTSFKPLEAYIYKDGFARVSTHQYTLDPNQLNDKFIHLTNSSIQKQNVSGPSADNPIMQSDGDGAGSKIGFGGASGLWKRLQDSGIDVEVLWRNICLCILKSLLVVDDKMTYQPCSFELFGYDILIDSDLRPWLIEVNASPSLARETQLDVRIKNQLIHDTIKLVDPPTYNRLAFCKILKRRLVDLTKANRPNMSSKHSSSNNDQELLKDLRDIFGPSYSPRIYGELPHHMGQFQALAPTPAYSHLLKLKGKIIKESNTSNGSADRQV